MSKKHDILGAFGVIGLSTLASRILGLVREMVIAFLFGAGMSADAFFVAFQIPNTFRRLMAEGSLTIAFVPVFSDTMIKKGRREAEALANAVFTLLTISLIVLTIAGILFSSPLIKVMVWGWEQAGIPGKIELTVLLTRIMFPYVFFISLVAFCMGVLNSLKHFAAPALSPALLNLSMILSAILLYPYCNPPILALAAGVIVGGFLQLILQIPFLMQKGIHLVFDFSLQHPGLRRIGSLMVYGVFGSAVYQINIIITRFLASFLPEGSISYLFYASRLLEFPLGIFVFAIGTAVLPSLSSLAAEGKQSELKETFVFALRLAMFIVIPAMIGLVVLRIPIINLLFERGSFTPHDTIQTSAALFYYALGLWAIAGVRVTVPLFYSLHDAKTPVLVGIMTVVANILFSLLLMGPLQHGGLALATTLASAVNLFFLLLLLRRKIGPLGIKATLGSVARALLSSLAMGLVAHAVCFHIDWTTPGMTITKILYLGSAVGGGVGAYFGLAFLLRFPELTYLKYIFRKKPSGPVRD